jgi:hypothetical protein
MGKLSDRQTLVLFSQLLNQPVVQKVLLFNSVFRFSLFAVFLIAIYFYIDKNYFFKFTMSRKK